jgi:hypothetical protein
MKWKQLYKSMQPSKLLPWWGCLFLTVLVVAPVKGQEALKPIAPRFNPDPRIHGGVAGGRFPMLEMVKGNSDGSCQGLSSPSPNHTLVVQRDFGFLSLQVSGDRKLTLMVKGPDGIFCRSGKKAELAGAWVAGKYEIWVGTDNGDRIDYRLSISETNQ